MLPPPDCVDPRLWLQANELAQRHTAHQGVCLGCGSPSPCRVLVAAQDAMRRAMAPVDPSPSSDGHPEVPPAGLRPMVPPRVAPPVGARFRHIGNLPEDEQPSVVEFPVIEVAAAEPEAPVGSRFRREPRVGRRRRRD